MLTTALFHPSRLGTHHLSPDSDPLLVNQEFAHRAAFCVLGFAVEIETNELDILAAATESWGEPTLDGPLPAVKLRLGVKESDATECPPMPSVRTYGHLLSMIADAENFILCDLRQSSAFGWVNRATLGNRRYLRYHFLEAGAMCLLSTSRMTPIHAACVSYAGHGFLLCGPSGAGKSTLAYSCARAGWTYTSDDASYLLWHCADRQMLRGNAQQVRFRPSAQRLFPEIKGRRLTPRAEGKPSIEIPTADLPGIITAADAQVHSIIVLHRDDSACAELTLLSIEELMPHFESSLYPFEEIWQPQLDALSRLLTAKMYALRYSSLEGAMHRLQQLAKEA